MEIDSRFWKIHKSQGNEKASSHKMVVVWMVNRISFHLGWNDETRKEYLSTGYWKRHYIRLSTG